MQHTRESHGANRPHEYDVHMIYDIQNKASKLAKTFRGHAKQRVMDAYLVDVTHGAVDMFVTFTNKNCVENLVHMVNTSLC